MMIIFLKKCLARQGNIKLTFTGNMLTFCVLCIRRITLKATKESSILLTPQFIVIDDSKQPRLSFIKKTSASASKSELAQSRQSSACPRPLLLMHFIAMKGIGEIFRVVEEISMAAVNHFLLKEMDKLINTVAARKNRHSYTSSKTFTYFTTSLNSSCIFISSSFYDIGIWQTDAPTIQPVALL